MARPEGEGFYVRLQPAPSLQAPAVFGVVGGFGLAGGIIAMATTSEPYVQGWVVGGSVLFGLLLFAFSYGQGFFPVELIGDERCLAWGGDRFVWSQIGSCEAKAGTLRLRSLDGRVLAEAKHLQPEAAAWTAQLIEASLADER